MEKVEIISSVTIRLKTITPAMYIVVSDSIVHGVAFWSDKYYIHSTYVGPKDCE